MRQIYPSDITREQLSVIEADLAAVKKTTHPRTYALYDIFCAVQYVLREGCRWRSLPHDFPKWRRLLPLRTLVGAGRRGESVLDRVSRKLVEAQRVKHGNTDA